MSKLNYFRKKGFTLIELLAVIVILAIILLIVMPIVLNVINDARKGAFEATARGLVKTAENQYMKNHLRDETLAMDYVFEDWQQVDGEPLEFSGRGPKEGIIRVHDNGDTEMAINDDNWCVTKDHDETDINPAVPYDGECNLPSEDVVIGNGDNPGTIDEDEDYDVDEYDDDEKDCFIDGECEGVDLPEHYVGTEGTWIPVAHDNELYNIRDEVDNVFGAGTKWEGTYLGGEDKNYLQVQDVNLSAHDNWDNGDFEGRYDGAGYNISNLSMTGGRIGLFDYVYGEAEIRNIVFMDAEFILPDVSSVSGGTLAEYVEYSLIENCVVINSVFIGDGDNWSTSFGGLVGYLDASIIRSSHTINLQMEFSSSVSGWFAVGGLVGQAYDSYWQADAPAQILNSSARNIDLKTKQDPAIGGILGVAANDNIKIANSYATGKIEGVAQIGGLIGFLDDVDGDYIEITNNYAMVDITHTESFIGGLVGYTTIQPDWFGYPFTFENNYAVANISTDFHPEDYQSWWSDHVQGFTGQYVYEEGEGLIEYSYYDSEVSGFDGAGLNTGKYGIPRSTSDMTYPHNDSNTYLNWDFAEVWAIDPCVNKGYPYLQWQTFSTAHLDLCILGSNSPVEEGETLIVQTHVYNHTGSSGDKTVNLTIDGSEKDSTTVNIPANSGVTVDLNWETEAGDAGEKTAVVTANGSNASIVVEVYGYDCPALAKNIGDEHDGGIIAYCDGTSGLLATTTENSTSEVWGVFAEPNLNTTSKSYGSGYDNTEIIVNEWPGTTTAADICWDLNSGGHSDWFLPSKAELNHFYQNYNKIGGFETAENPFYWSSSEYDEDPEYSSGWLQSFSFGSQYYANKGHEYRVRCARYFD